MVQSQLERKGNLKTQQFYIPNPGESMLKADYIIQSQYTLESGRIISSYVSKGDTLTEEFYTEVVQWYKTTLHPDIIPLPSSERFVVLVDSEQDELIAVIALSYIHENAVPLIFNRIPKGMGDSFLEKFNDELTAQLGINYQVSLTDAQAGTVAIMTDKLIDLNELVEVATILFHESEMVINTYLNRSKIIMIATKPVQKLLKFTGISLHHFPSANSFLGTALTDDELVQRMSDDLSLANEHLSAWLNGYILNKRLNPIPGVLIFSKECPINNSRVIKEKRNLEL